MTFFEIVEGAVREAAVWIDTLYTDARVESSRYYKEVYLCLGGRPGSCSLVFVFKVIERRWYLTPSALARVARGLLERGRRLGRRVAMIVFAWRVSGGALRMLDTRLKWVVVAPLTMLRASTVESMLRVAVERALGPWMRRWRRVATELVERMALWIVGRRRTVWRLVLPLIARRLRRLRVRLATGGYTGVEKEVNPITSIESARSSRLVSSRVD